MFKRDSEVYEYVSVEPGCLVRSSPSSLPALPGGCEKPMGVGRRGQVCSLSRAAPWRLCLYISTPRGGGGGDTSLPPRGQGTFDNVWRHVCLSHLGEGVLLASRGGQRPGGCKHPAVPRAAHSRALPAAEVEEPHPISC